MTGSETGLPETYGMENNKGEHLKYDRTDTGIVWSRKKRFLELQLKDNLLCVREIQDVQRSRFEEQRQGYHRLMG